MSKRVVVHKIHWTPIIIAILLVGAGTAGFYYYMNKKAGLEEQRISLEKELEQKRLEQEKELEVQKQLQAKEQYEQQQRALIEQKMREEEEQRKKEQQALAKQQQQFDEQKQKAIRDYNNYISTLNFDFNEMKNRMQMYNSANTYNGLLNAALSYANQFELTKKHGNDFLEFLNQNKQFLESANIDVFEAQKVTQDNLLIYQMNIEQMENHITEIANQQQAQTQAEEQMLQNLFKLFALLI